MPRRQRSHPLLFGFKRQTLLPTATSQTSHRRIVIIQRGRQLKLVQKIPCLPQKCSVEMTVQKYSLGIVSQTVPALASRKGHRVAQTRTMRTSQTRAVIAQKRAAVELLTWVAADGLKGYPHKGGWLKAVVLSYSFGCLRMADSRAAAGACLSTSRVTISWKDRSTRA